MANRHLSRSIVMQSLFEWDFNSYDKNVVNDIVRRNTQEFAPAIRDTSFMECLVVGILQKQEKLDTIIEKAAPGWPIDKISIADRNILRIGLYELLFGDREDVPPKVAINEAIELAKSFGGDKSGRFVNGVLGAVYKELGEPGKDYKSKDKIVDKSKMPIDKLVGAIVYAVDNDEIYLGLIHDIFGRWTLTKGHLNKDETDKNGVIRKAKDEMNATITGVEEVLGSNEYIASDPKLGKIRKQVSYYLAKADFTELTAGESGGISDARWFKLSEIDELNIYDDILPIVTKGIDILLKRG